MILSEELFSKINTLPWQALFEYAKTKGIKDDKIRNKDKTQIIKDLSNQNLIDEKEINKLIDDYIYGNRVTFSLWRFEEKISDVDIQIIKSLEGKEIICNDIEFRKVKIQKVTELKDRIEIIYIYSKLYSYMDENGKLSKIWEQHRGCSLIGIEKSYVAYIVKHEKMTTFFSNDLQQEIHKHLNQIKPPLSALNRIFKKSKRSKIVLQGTEGEKTAISRSEGLTTKQEEEMKRVKNGRYNTSGSYITPINEQISATVRYNIKKGNISILKHLSVQELFKWTDNAIKIIFEEIDNLKGKSVEKIFEELGLKLKWSLLSKVEQEKMNWILTNIIANEGNEQSIEFPKDKIDILNNQDLFIKISRPYCEKCESYEIPFCKECYKKILQPNMSYCPNCGAPLQPVCKEGHKLNMNKYWYIPTPNCDSMIKSNISKVYPNKEYNYSICIMEDTLMISSYSIGGEEQVLFDDVEEFRIDNFKNNNNIINYAVEMKEKCGTTCSGTKIAKCLYNKEQICLPKLFYGIIPGFKPQPHKGGEYGDISGVIHVKGKNYEMKGIIKSNSSKSKDKANKELLSTSKQGGEIIRQFIEQGMIDERCEVIIIAAPQHIDNSLKGTIRFLARKSNKKVMFIELEEICKLLKILEKI